MRFSCKKCSAQYTIADEKIRGKVIKVRCKRCNHLLVVRDEGVPAARSARSAAPKRQRTANLEREFEDAFGGLVDGEKPSTKPTGPALKAPDLDEQEWYCGLDGAEDGPLSLRQMAAGLRSGRITEDHFVWREGMGDWLPIEEVPELAGMLDRGQAVEAEEAHQHRAAAEKKRQAEAEKKRQAEAEEKRQAEAEKKRQAEAEKKRQAEAEKKRQAEAEKKRQAEAEKKRQAEAEKKRQAEAEKKRQAEAKEKRQAEVEKKRQDAERKKKADKQKDKKKDKKKAEKGQEPKGKPGAEAGGLQADLEDPDRKELLARVLKKRAEVRVDRHAGRIAEHFFVDEDEVFEREEVLPPPPVEDGEDDLAVAEVADQLEQDSLEDERLLLQVDPMAVVEKRKEMGEISQVIARQAGVTSEKKRVGLGLLVVVLFIMTVGGLVALAFSQGWFGGVPWAERKPAGGQEGVGAGGSDVDYGNLSPEEAARIRSSIWNIEPKKRGGRASGHNGARRPSTAGRRTVKSKLEKDLMAFYQQQDEAKSEASPRLPRGAPEGMVAGIQFPTGVPGSVDMSMPGKSKTEVVPEQRETVADAQKLTSVQIRLVIRRNARRVKKCFEKQLKRDPDVSGKLLVTARVQPSGKITKVSVGPEKFHGTYLEECLTKEVGRWRFPTFKGEPYDLTFPYALSARQTY